ncbi:DUF2752 domain-containing protein [Streptomyces lasiicapitis]|uniref:Membrane protein n=1 Tax=Streptomyces lasiicapitis TaxID=1923961 RepID=A0ABQ2MFD0_9ACTN|nr:DUF2752 domain-containing protein [Streptomyces lasiicapitis]GGO50541.1 membrane protein [Streptomyces lasiicapitis]
MNPEPETVAPPRPDSGLRRLAVPLGVLGAVTAAFAYVATIDPNEPGHYPACPLLYYTGVYCPGCGGLRSAHAFAHGDLSAALGANALAVVGFGLFAAGWAWWAARAARGRPVRLELGRTQLWAVGAVLAVFTLVRNLPFGAWLNP